MQRETNKKAEEKGTQSCNSTVPCNTWKKIQCPKMSFEFTCACCNVFSMVFIYTKFLNVGISFNRNRKAAAEFFFQNQSRMLAETRVVEIHRVTPPQKNFLDMYVYSRLMRMEVASPNRCQLLSNGGARSYDTTADGGTWIIQHHATIIFS